MEASATRSAAEASSGSRTIADLLACAVARFRDRAAVRVKRDGGWSDVTFGEVGAEADALSRGLIDVGVQPGDRVAILCRTRPEWTYAHFAAAQVGAVVVPVYPTNSAEECAWVLGDSDAVAVVCENAEQVAKVASVRDRLPQLRRVLVVDADAPSEQLGDAITLERLRARGRNHEHAEIERRYRAVQPSDAYTFIYTSGTTGPPKGCVLSHANYRAMLDMAERAGSLAADEVTYLYLPLAHSYALLVQLLSYDVGATIAYWSNDQQQIVAELSEVRPTSLPSVPRVFEKVYALVTGSAPAEQIEQATQVGVAVRDLQARGEPVPAALQAAFDRAEAELFGNVRAAFGGRVRQAVTGAAPIAREILEFFYACGVPVMEGYGMTETATAATFQTPADHKFGTVGRALPGVELRVADDGEVLVRGANVFAGYHKRDDAAFGTVEDGWLHTGDLGALDADGFLTITGRKKDIIITAGGKNVTPANLENDLQRSRWVAHAVMHGDRRPYPVMLVTLDAEQVVPWAEREGLPTDIPSLADHPRVRALVQADLDAANAGYARAEQAKRFFVLDHELTPESGELTPSLKVKRGVINDRYADRFAALYSD